MLAYNDKIKEIANRLLEAGSVDMIVGFRKGTVPMMNVPCFINKPHEVSSLTWDSNCRTNLANYLTNCKGKIAVIAKGCDSRSIVTLITENKIKREQLYIIGIPCTGMIDSKKINSLVSGEITQVHETDKTVIVKTLKNSETIFDKKEILQRNCTLCLHRNPVISDEMVADQVKEQQVSDKYSEIKKIKEMSHQDRWDYFENLFSPCIRCYACKNACPLCYCPVCFVDESDPQWVGKGQNPIDIRLFHFLRAFHCAGRCSDCGACEQACPVEINMRVLTTNLEKDCKEQFNLEAGLSIESRSALDIYRPDDPEEFIK